MSCLYHLSLSLPLPLISFKPDTYPISKWLHRPRLVSLVLPL